MNNQQITKNLNDLNMFFEAIGFDKKTIADHQGRLGKLILFSLTEKFEKLSTFKNKKSFPKNIKLFKDIFDYYGEYIDEEVMEKIIKEETKKIYAGYFKSMNQQFPK